MNMQKLSYCDMFVGSKVKMVTIRQLGITLLWLAYMGVASESRSGRSRLARVLSRGASDTAPCLCRSTSDVGQLAYSRANLNALPGPSGELPTENQHVIAQEAPEVVGSLRIPALLGPTSGLAGSVEHRALFVPSTRAASVGFVVQTELEGHYRSVVSGTVESQDARLGDRLFVLTASLAHVSQDQPRAGLTQTTRLGEVSVGDNLEISQSLLTDGHITSVVQASMTISLKSTIGRFKRFFTNGGFTNGKRLRFTRVKSGSANLFILEEQSESDRTSWFPVLQLTLCLRQVSTYTAVDSSTNQGGFSYIPFLGGGGATSQKFAFQYQPLSPFSVRASIKGTVVVSSGDGSSVPQYSMTSRPAPFGSFAEYKRLKSNFRISGQSVPFSTEQEFQLVSEPSMREFPQDTVPSFFTVFDYNEQTAVLRLTLSVLSGSSPWPAEESIPSADLVWTDRAHIKFGVDVRCLSRVVYVSFVAYTQWRGSRPNILSEDLVELRFDDK